MSGVADDIRRETQDGGKNDNLKDNAADALIAPPIGTSDAGNRLIRHDRGLLSRND
jgi:hypothetical protein